MCIFVQNWFRIDTKMMRNFEVKSHFVQNHATVAQENWLFCGNPLTLEVQLQLAMQRMELDKRPMEVTQLEHFSKM